MEVITTVDDFRGATSSVARPMSLTPTMGALHKGHMSLIQRAQEENQTSVVSIFVNPTQFGPSEDFGRYPREIEHDLNLLRGTGVDFIFAPSTGEMYPEGFKTHVEVEQVSETMEGSYRPNHFQGVATIVCKLLSIIRPDRLYLGQKDAQQNLVIKRLNSDLNLGAEIVVCPTIRESDGLALSSRNQYLNPEERKAATVLHRALLLAEESGRANPSDIKHDMIALIESEPLARIDYVSIVDADSLDKLGGFDRHALVALAVYIGNTRLIDNVVI